MAWGARQIEDGTWRICERRGRTIMNVCEEQFPGVEIKFASRSQCEKCTKALNDGWWDAYKKKLNKEPQDFRVFNGILNMIHDFGGISDSDWKEMCK